MEELRQTIEISLLRRIEQATTGAECATAVMNYKHFREALAIVPTPSVIPSIFQNTLNTLQDP